MKAYWTTLSHNGVCFPEEYQPEGLQVNVKGRAVALTPLAEEMAYNLAKKKDTPYVQDPVFRSNFASDFVEQLPDWCKDAAYEDVDFSQLFAKVDREKAAKDGMTKEMKRALAADRKTRRDALKERYGYAILDGKKVEFANYMVEPPGLFMGRGQHPMRGRWKPRIAHGDVILNLDEKTKLEGAWKEIVHDHRSMWMAKWIDKLTAKEKYVWLHESSHIQQSRNKAKYDNAMKMEGKQKKVEEAIERALASKDPVRRQVATVCYLIDKLGMRVGDEKDEDEADTVGASTLRVEHVRINGDAVEFDFLGKDSIRWKKSIKPPPYVLKNLEEFKRGKKPDTEIFHDVTSSMVNQFLSSIVSGLTAKVFRTYHATVTARDALASERVEEMDEVDKLFHAKEANLKAAIFCNHQRTPPKTWDKSYENKKQKLEEVRSRDKRDGKRVKKLERELDFYVRTKNYNLNTSLKNYIDPRVMKAWCDKVGLDWAKIYSKSLRRKFSWVEQPTGRVQKPVEMIARSPRPVEGSP